ncbi:hypothetical protein G647_01416 [Cladophialophora carrionii CBS 160.54]|uniref:Uncharacterized protein n=1 Tax=Cladophialophora carrionii CBS 160.54 TaxID=1279043 RepID=V9DPX5_9EURO|nr:uncharacterized protein G647_01416 [Cladophialophora carrionii CBS 160.54]ETI28964.1 hypothetical protein G647_01416 [Cladophialophora carrionii CBS 160.54]
MEKYDSNPDSQGAESINSDIRPYTRLVSAMSRNHPNLSSLARILCQPTEEGAAAVVEFRNTVAAAERFYTSTQLQKYMTNHHNCTRRLFIMQGLPSNYIETLGAAFNIDPNFFARQILSGMPLHTNKGMRDVPLLSSHPTSRESFCIRYHELREFADAIGDWELRVMDQPRRVSVSKFNGEFDGVGIVRKTASIWFRAREKGEGWDAIILLDPPIGDQFYVGLEKRQCTLRSVLYRGGYIDFSPLRQDSLALDHAARAGPRRESALEDLIYYYTQAEPPGVAGYDSPETVTGVLKRYVASHWMIQLRYSLDLLVKYENTYHRACFFASVSSTLIQNSLRDVQHLNDRVAGWREQVDRSISQFKASGTLGSFPGQAANDPSEDDFTHILHDLRELRGRVQAVISSMTGLVSIIETMRMKELSILAMVFIPLGLASQLFSMEDEYAPGKPGFWVYCVVGLCLVLLVFVVAFGLNPGTTLLKTLKLKRRALAKAPTHDRLKEHDEEIG